MIGPALGILLAGVASAAGVAVMRLIEEKGLGPPGRSRRQHCIDVGGKCLYPYRLGGSECIARLLRSGAFKELLGSREVCGVLLYYEDTEPIKALRRLEARIISYRIELERNPDNLRARYRLELLDSVYKDLASMGSPTLARVVLLLCSQQPSGELRRLAELNNCSLSYGFASFFNSLTRPLPVPRGRLAEELALHLSRQESLSRLSAYDGVVIGEERSSGAPVLLPTFSEELGGLHTAIVGPSGRGKTTLLARVALLASTVYEDVCTLCIDPKGDLEEMLSPVLLPSAGIETLERDVAAARSLGRPLVVGRELLAEETLDLQGVSDVLYSTCPRSILVIDEAWRVMEASAASKAIREARSRRISMVMASQQPDDLPSTVLNNVHSLVAFGSTSDTYVDAVARIGGVGEEANALKTLGVGEALLAHFLLPAPILVKVRPPPIRVKKPSGSALASPGRAPWASG